MGSRGEEPDIAGCKIACPNKALTKDSIRGLQQRQAELESSKKGATSEEVIRIDHLIDAYKEQIARFWNSADAQEERRVVRDDAPSRHDPLGC